MVIGIKVIAANFKIGTVKHTNTSYFTMVAKGDNGKPTEVPGLILETKEDVKRFLEVIKRKELKASSHLALQPARLSLLVEPENTLLENERCILKL